MKLIRAYCIFTSRRYRGLMLGLLFALILSGGLIHAYVSELSYLCYIYVIFLAGLIPLYGDMEVFAGVYGREGGQAGALLTSLAGARVVKLGVLADRLFVLLWVVLVNLSLVVFRASYLDTGIYTLLTGSGAVFVLMTVSVNINRCFSTRWSVMAANTIEMVFVDTAAVALWLLFPYGSLLTSILAVLLTVLSIWLSVIHTAYHLERSYCDESFQKGF